MSLDPVDLAPSYPSLLPNHQQESHCDPPQLSAMMSDSAMGPRDRRVSQQWTVSSETMRKIKSSAYGPASLGVCHSNEKLTRNGLSPPF